MRKITAVEFVSVDGVAEAPEVWSAQYFNEEMMGIAQAGMDSADAMLLGRRTYQDFAAYWPQQPNDAPFAEWTNTTHKYVVSTTLNSLEYGPATLISRDVTTEVTNLKEQPGKGISLLGSPTLVRSLLPEGIIDELAMFLVPIVVGKGKRLFEEPIGELPLRLADSRTLSNGVVYLTYGQAEGGMAGSPRVP
jgi:dihydrofolate reductase